MLLERRTVPELEELLEERLSLLRAVAAPRTTPPERLTLTPRFDAGPFGGRRRRARATADDEADQGERHHTAPPEQGLDGVAQKDAGVRPVRSGTSVTIAPGSSAGSASIVRPSGPMT
jgi:hypothetical protein